MKGEDGSDEAGDPGGRAPQFAEEPPGLEGGDGLLDEGPDLCVGPVHRLLACGEDLPPSPARDADRAAGAPVALVRPAGHTCAPPHPQVGECEQSLAGGAQAPPTGADRTAVPPQLLREEAE